MAVMVFRSISFGNNNVERTHKERIILLVKISFIVDEIKVKLKCKCHTNIIPLMKFSKYFSLSPKSNKLHK